ncbi:fimbrial protein [Salmonella enterica subsp. diarizonae serovar 47:k:z53:[z84]]|nr:fimbrial protein [Salmonella enterica subsp. diarizonae serovar 47:k:z53:[z84]]
MKTGLRPVLLMLSCWSSLLWISAAWALDVNIEIKGKIHIPTCRISGNDTAIHIPFGRISLQKVDGIHYAETRTVRVSCKYYRGQPYIRLEGAVLSGAGENVLRTSGANTAELGIALYQGGSVDSAYPMKIGAGEQGVYGFKIKRGLSKLNAENSEFTFTAVPYKYGRTDLKAGTFSAAVTMSISYI